MRNYRERRLGCRIPLDCQIRFKVQGQQGIHEGRTKNLSVGGIAFKSEYKAQTGDLLEVVLIPPKGSTVAPLDTLVQVTRAIPGDAECEIAGRIKEIRA